MTSARELSDESVRDQAVALLEYAAKQRANWRDVFDQWASSKGFVVADRAAIRRLLEQD